MADESPIGKNFPYAERYPVNRGMPEKGRPRADILTEIHEMSEAEDVFWQTGKCSGTMYRGDLPHYEFLAEAFAPFAHVNALQRDMCPSSTRFEGEIIAMGLDLMHGAVVTEQNPEHEPCGSVTGGGTDSIVTAMLCYREWGRDVKGIQQPQAIVPVTAHPAFDKGCHLFGIELVRAPVDPETTLVDLAWVADHINENTVCLVGSAGNYPYGTIDDIGGLSDLAVEHGIGLHVDGCLGGYILPWGEELGHPIPAFDFRHPGVTTISADTHKYGYGFKGTSTLLYRDKSLRQYQYFLMTEWPGGKYFSPGLAGSRSGGLLAATWASMVSLGRDGYLEIAARIFETAYAMQDVVRTFPELRIFGDPSFCFSFTSDEFDIYHVNDFMREKGWRFNGQQYPNGIHMCVTGPQTQAGVVDTFAEDLAGAVAYAKNPPNKEPFSGAVYGGVPGGPTPEADEFIRDVMTGMLDKMQSVPPAPDA